MTSNETLTIKPILKRIALGVQYDGSYFNGWQSQVDGRTIQDNIEKALSRFIALPSSPKNRVITAGRTDTGVHALGQVVHVDVPVSRLPFAWVRGINSYLPSSIRIMWAQEVPGDFDARFSAQERAYSYLLYVGPIEPPILDKKVGYLMLPPGKELNIDFMKQAAAMLIGEHDFSSFRSSECQSKTPIKTLYQFEIVADLPKIYFFIRGNAFLHHMIRNIIACLLFIGQGKNPPEWILELLEKKNRAFAAPTFSPDGLYLTRVGYPNHFNIPEPNLACGLFPHHDLVSIFNKNYI
ncbi:MAG: tRNA pseudouridine(38-40) synthase TruA [Betaproteobacteria bacterium]